ncbi:MAG: glycosyltransferase family 2 protein, partial [Candidatus Omnitrophica bacterium]|nr:glycosyltransferase family 2 protein [Candidatus Omnitrophota bacterium]
SQDDTARIVKGFHDERIKYFKNEKDLGYAESVELYRERSTGDILYLLSAKSRISKDALERAYEGFKLSSDVGAVTRPYYWFGADLDIPVRAKARYSREKDALISIQDDVRAIIAVFNTLDNPGGLAYRKNLIDTPFNKNRFVESAYPFAAIFKKHKVVYLKDYTMACPAFLPSGSQSAPVYEKSPIQNWVDLFNNIFPEDEFKLMRGKCIKDFIAVNYIGLVQIKNYAFSYRYLLREILLLIKYRWQNLLNPAFWFFSLGTIILPKRVLIKLVKIYKDRLNSKMLIFKDGQTISLKRG